MKSSLLAVITLASLTSAAGDLADAVQGPDLTATGRVVSTGNASLVVQTDDNGRSMAFVIGTTTDMPAGVAAGTRVTVHYHPVGIDQQMADKIVLLEPGAGAALGSSPNGQPAPASPTQSPAQTPTEATPPAVSSQPDVELPRTASPIPLVGLASLAAFLAGALLRSFARR